MNGTPRPPVELEAALADIRLIRDVMNKVRTSPPIREIMRPLFLLGFWFAPLFVAYGVICQWIVDAKSPLPMGFGKGAWIGIATSILFSMSAFAKYWYSRAGMNRHGYNYLRFIRKLLIEHGYSKILLAGLSMIAISSWVAIDAGHYHQIPGLSMVGIGGILVLLPLTLPLPESNSAGLFLILAGFLSLFILPAYPFYKVSLLYGLFNVLMGIQGIRMKEKGLSSGVAQDSDQNHG